MTRFWTRSLAGQIVGLLVLALALSYAIGCLVYVYERSRLMQGIARDEFLARAAATANLVEVAPAEYHDEILRTAGTSLARYWVTEDAPTDIVAWQGEARRQLMRALSPKGPDDINPALSRAKLATFADATWEELPADAWPLGRPARFVELHDSWNGFGLAVQLDDGRWLSAASAKTTALLSRLQSYIPVAVTALAISLVAFVVAGRVARPLRDLASAAERFGRGEDVGLLKLEGTRDIRRTSEAFNRMQERLRRFVEDRTRMIAAASHDLRTPITSLRLQAEFVSDPVVRERMLATLDEMSATTDAVLAFAREEAETEPSRVVDLAALLESLCDDLGELGWDVRFAAPAAFAGRLPYRCRPAAIRRGLRNIIENAVRYGERARVTLEQSGEWLDVVVEDDGPGILDEDAERVFAPFVRLDSSRNRDTGGTGMGLAIARSVVRGHGGDILLANRSAGIGLRATVRLPRDEVELSNPRAETRRPHPTVARVS
jgi:signal transduction histidine kinase